MWDIAAVRLNPTFPAQGKWGQPGCCGLKFTRGMKKEEGGERRKSEEIFSLTVRSEARKGM